MSIELYKDIKNRLERMMKIEYGSSISDMNDVNFFIDDENNKLIVKNYDVDLELNDCICIYLNVIDYNYIQQFQYLYNFNECEIIEFDLDEW